MMNAHSTLSIRLEPALHAHEIVVLLILFIYSGAILEQIFLSGSDFREVSFQSRLTSALRLVPVWLVVIYWLLGQYEKTMQVFGSLRLTWLFLLFALLINLFSPTALVSIML